MGRPPPFPSGPLSRYSGGGLGWGLLGVWLQNEKTAPTPPSPGVPGEGEKQGAPSLHRLLHPELRQDFLRRPVERRQLHVPHVPDRLPPFRRRVVSPGAQRPEPAEELRRRLELRLRLLRPTDVVADRLALLVTQVGKRLLKPLL